MNITEAINTSPVFVPPPVPSDEMWMRSRIGSFIAYHPALDFAILILMAVLTVILRVPPAGDLTPVALTPDQANGAEKRKGCSDDDARC